MLEKLVVTALFGAIPVVLLISSGPPKRESWWYPNPRRFDYVFKLWFYAILRILPQQRIGRIAIRLWAVGLFGVSMDGVWW